MNRETGEFEKEGNIFKDGKTENTSKLARRDGMPDNVFTIISLDVSEARGAIEPKACVFSPIKSDSILSSCL